MIDFRKRAQRVPRSTQGGVVLFVALIVLVVMALTGLAMIRQSTTGLSIAGNLGMRQNALSGADLGTETAVSWWQPLTQTPGALDSDISASGYFSDWGGGASDPNGYRLAGDPTNPNYPWGSSVLATSNDGSGNAVRYIVERMCMLANTPAAAVGQDCVQTPVIGGATKSGDCATYPNDPLCNPQLTVYYRVTSQVTGPRNSVSYIQVMLAPM